MGGTHNQSLNHLESTSNTFRVNIYFNRELMIAIFAISLHEFSIPNIFDGFSYDKSGGDENNL